MSENSAKWYQKHVEMFGKLKNYKIFRMPGKISKKIDYVLELLSSYLWIQMILFMELWCLIFVGYILMNWGIVGKLIVIAYATYWYNDRKSPENGRRGQGFEFTRSCAWMRHFCNHFPVKCVKTVDLPPNKNYLFAIYPHGIISIGAFINFATSCTNFRELFPGIRSRLCTLNYHFCCPIYRDLLLSWGIISAKRESIVNVLSQSNNKLAVCNYDGYTSNAVALIVGGAQEALDSRPGGDYKLVLKPRKGFVKIAIQTGASLVPVFTFGEIDVLDQPANEPGSKLRAYQDFVKKWTGVSPINAYGRGLTEKSWGMIPFRRELTTVIGAPIHTEKNENPSRDEVEKVHTAFVEAIEKLFHEHKSKYVKNHETVKLIIE